MHSTAKLVGLSLSFSTAALALAPVVNILTLTSISAQNALNGFHAKIGQGIDSISKDMHNLVNYKAQHKFTHHVLKYVRMRSRQLATEEKATGIKQFIFVLHNGYE